MKLSGATSLVGVTAIFGAAISSAAVAQQSDDTAALMAMDVGSLRTEVQARYDRALAASLDPAYVNASDSRYLWAIEAKAQCGIALGFLKSSTKDSTSLANCVRASDLMTMQPRQARTAPSPQTAAAPRPVICDDRTPILIFFDFDSAAPPPSSRAALETFIQNAGVCRWNGIEIAGHTDLSGSDEYHLGLSRRRADAV